jgi:uridine monophosphate synthetase
MTVAQRSAFFAKLEKRYQEVNSLLCVGLDPHSADLGENPGPDAAFDFCAKLIEATKHVAVA